MIFNFEQREVIRLYPETLLAKRLLMKLEILKIKREIERTFNSFLCS